MSLLKQALCLGVSLSLSSLAFAAGPAESTKAPKSTSHFSTTPLYGQNITVPVKGVASFLLKFSADSIQAHQLNLRSSQEAPEFVTLKGNAVIEAPGVRVESSSASIHPSSGTITMDDGVLSLTEELQNTQSFAPVPPSTQKGYSCREGQVAQNGIKTGFSSVSVCLGSHEVTMSCRSGSMTTIITPTPQGCGL